MILLISDFDFRGSGYMHIAVSLCNQLATRHGRRVTALGIGYDRSEHNWPFSILPVHQQQWGQHIPAIIHNFRSMAHGGRWHPIDAIVVALDIPLQERMLKLDRGGLPYIGIFPVESGPLCMSWSLVLSQMTERLVISQFGLKMMEDAGVDGTHLPIGIDTNSWRLPLPEERAQFRKDLGISEDDFVVLTVADNQERKNLSLTAEVMALLNKKVKSKWMLLTRVNSPVGWKLDDLAMGFGITDIFSKFDKGLPFDRLWLLYAAADAFLLTSKAEGLGMPILEAMAVGVPVVATHCTAIPEHIYKDPDWSRCKGGKWEKGRPKGQRGFGIPVEYYNIDPWGNSIRSFPNVHQAVKSLLKIAKMNPAQKEVLKQAGREYAMTRTWENTGDVLERGILSAISKARPPVAQPTEGLPASAPRPIPIMTPGSVENDQETPTP